MFGLHLPKLMYFRSLKEKMNDWNVQMQLLTKPMESLQQWLTVVVSTIFTSCQLYRLVMGGSPPKKSPPPPHISQDANTHIHTEARPQWVPWSEAGPRAKGRSIDPSWQSVPQLKPPTHSNASSDKVRLSSLSANINMTHQHTIWGPCLHHAASLII